MRNRIAVPPRVSASASRLVVAALSLVFATAPALEGHELKLLPAEKAGGLPEVIPISAPGEHLAPSSSLLDFGAVPVGASDEIDLQLTNVSGRDLTLVPEAEAPFSVTPGGPLAVPVGATVALTVVLDGTTAGDVAGELILRSTHAGVAAAWTERVPLEGRIEAPASLRLSVPTFALDDVDRFDFGYVPQRTYAPEDAPTFVVEITNDGGAAATGLAIAGGHALPIASLGTCYWDGGVAEVCVSLPDGSDLAGATIPAGGTLSTHWRLFPYRSDWYLRDFSVSAANAAETAPFRLTGGFVPLGLPGGPFLGAETGGPPLAANTGTTSYRGYGRSTDPLGLDPIAGFVPAGYDPRTSFAAGQVDAVDARTGNVVIPISLGGAQPVEAGLAFELELVINSRVWRRETNWGIPQELEIPDVDVRGQRRVVALFEALASWYPNPAYNATAGVSLHLGRLIPPEQHQPQEGWYTVDPTQANPFGYERAIHSGPRWLYIDPSGNEHEFYLNLHGTEPIRSGNRGVDYFHEPVQYTRDGSFLRLKQQTTNESSGTGRVIWLEMPDGQRHLFEQYDAAHPTLPDHWRLRRIEDRFGNAVQIDYTSTSWTLRGGRVERSAPSQVLGTFSAHDRRRAVVAFAGTRPTSVKLRGFDGGGDRTFQLQYSQPFQLERPPQDRFHPHFELLGIDTSILTRTLDAVVQPDGSRWAFDWQAGAGNRDLFLRSVELPTGATVHYQHDEVWDQSVDCTTGGPAQPLQGVVRRWVVDAGGALLADRRFLRQFRTPPGMTAAVCHTQPSPNVAPRAEQRIAVWEALENGLSSVAVRYYSTYPLGHGPSGWTHVERHLNLTRATPDPMTPSSGRFLTSELYSCDLTMTASAAQGVGYDDMVGSNPNVGDRIDVLTTQCLQKEREFARYEVELGKGCPQSTQDLCLRDARVVDRRTEYMDDNAGQPPRTRWVRRQHWELRRPGATSAAARRRATSSTRAAAISTR